ncbi:DUF721 domain-containing protein [Selenomonas flueggei]|uniref:DUF721 domain-containing protein n=1 Tax=Selenomonas flueggei ATCC 43531 TaxID=638302 RepID=C4V1P8_9FIRM|nr:DUF721 domain-containing protein [Selenomonas flueggei]EEQ49185.1 hypothetical protein HMPREF0908_0501 [Selenomonas flueggei ATCC 43531]
MRTTLGTADAGDDVRAAIHRLGPSFERDYITHTTISHWADIMGEMVARRVRAVAVKDKKLFLYAPDAVWKNEMRMSAPEIVQRVNNYAGGRMVTEIAFARTMRPIMETADNAAAETPAAYRRALAQTGLTDAEIAHGAALASAASDSDLRTHIERAYLTTRKARHLKEARGLTPCPVCGRFVSGACMDCRRSEERGLRREVRAILRREPWAKLADITRWIPSADALMVGSERADLIRSIAGRTEYTAQDSENARLLTMLHRGLPPEQVTPKKIQSTFWELRNELITTREFWEEMKQRRAKKS